MNTKKRVLLIAGGGTIGSYTAKELLRLGYLVDIICLEDKVSDEPHLRFFKMQASLEALRELFEKERYDGIVNFLHYNSVEEYQPYHELLSKNTEHLVFLSSYRVYADKQIPITENAPLLLDVSEDQEFVEQEQYAISKAHCERLLQVSEPKNWTIVRPVISFAATRFDLLMYSGDYVIRQAEAKLPIYMPQSVKDLTAGIDWAYNSGKLIANLLFKKQAIGEAYTVSSAPNLTWGEVAEAYAEVTGAEFLWVDEQEFLDKFQMEKATRGTYWRYVYDRCFDRRIDNTKILKATGLSKQDFCTVQEGLQKEFEIYQKERKKNG